MNESINLNKRLGFWIGGMVLFMLSYPLLKSFIMFVPGG